MKLLELLSERLPRIWMVMRPKPQQQRKRPTPARPRLDQLLGLQQLEAREMLYLSAANEGPFYAINSQAYSAAAPGVLSGVSGSNQPFTAHLVTQAAHGTVSMQGTGAWSYTPNAGFTGPDSFQYDATDSRNNTSNTATVSLSVTFGDLSDVDQTKIAVDTLSLPMQILGSSSGQPATAANLALVYNSSTAQPVETLEQDFQASMEPAASGTLEMTTAINGVQYGPTYTTTSNLSVNDPTIRLSMQDGTPSLATGRYADSQTVTNVTNMSHPITVSTLTGAVNVVNDESSPFGAGWEMRGLYHIFQNTASGVPAGVLLTPGDGSGWYFTQGTGNSYTSPNGPFAFSTLTSLSGGGWQLVNQYGTTYTFNSSGLLTSTELHTTETTTYGWTGSDLTSVTDAFGRSVTLVYSNGLLSSITNFAGSVWSFGYSAGVGGSTLTSITEPNPGSGSPVWNFGYSSNLLTSAKDPDSNQTSYGYSGNTLAADTLPGGAGESYTSEQSYGGGQPGGFQPANAVLSSTVQNSKTDPNGNISYFTTDLLANVVTYTDPYGQVTTYTRDSNGLVTQLTEPPPATGDQAPVTTFTHDSLGNETSASGAHPSYGTYIFNSFSEPVSFTDSSNNEWTSVYDTHGNLTSTTDPLNNTVSYTVDSLGHPLTMTQPAPNDGSGTVTTTYTRDSDERLTKITFPDNSTETFAYNTIDLPTSVTDGDNNTTQTAYDLLGRVTSVTNAAGGISTTTYDAANNVLTKSDFLGNVTDYQYNSRNELVQETLPAQTTGGTNPVLAWTYDSNGNTLTYTNALSEVTTNTWDKLNRMTSETLPPPAQGQSGPETTFAYDNDSHKISETNALSGTTTYAYANTDIGQLTSVELPPLSGTGQGPTTNYFYDGDGRQNQVENALSQYTTTTFTADGQVASVKDNLNNATSYVYGHGGELLSTTDPLNHTSSRQYDSRYRLVQTTDANNAVTSLTLDGAGNETKLVDSDNNATSWTFNALNLPLTETNTLGTTTTGYNKAGLVTSIEDADSRVRDFTYNNDQQLTAENWMSGGTVVATMAYSYDLAGQLTAASDPNSAYAFAYSGDGDVTSVDNNGTPNVPHVVLTNAYDAMGDRTSQSAAIAGTADFINNYWYDGDQNLTMVQQQQQSGGNTVANKEIDYAYNAIGQFTAIGNYDQFNGPRTDIATGAFSYDTDGRLTGLVYTADGGQTAIDAYGWGYNAGGLVTSLTSNDGTASYGYDPTNQLTSATYTTNSGGHQPANESYSFTANGNRDMTGYSTGSDNLTSSDGTYNYGYDADGNRVSRTQIAGTYSTDYRTTYTWDYRNRLTDVDNYDNNGVLKQHVHYVFDVFDHLIATEVDPTGGGSYTKISQYVLDVSPEIPAAGVPGTATAQPALVFDGNQNLIGRNLVALDPAGVDAVMIEGTVTSTSQADSDQFNLFDNLGSLRNIVNNASATIDRLVYNSSGQVAYESSPTIAHFAGFAGGHADPYTGLVNDYHRWFDPANGKWLSDDPTDFSGGDTDLSRYAVNSATNVLDPSGLWGFWDWWVGNGFFNQQGQALDQANQKLALKLAQFSGTFPQNFRTIQKQGYSDAANDAAGLAKTSIYFAAAGGGFMGPSAAGSLSATDEAIIGAAAEAAKKGGSFIEQVCAMANKLQAMIPGGKVLRRTCAGGQEVFVSGGGTGIASINGVATIVRVVGEEEIVTVIRPLLP